MTRPLNRIFCINIRNGDSPCISITKIPVLSHPSPIPSYLAPHLAHCVFARPTVFYSPVQNREFILQRNYQIRPTRQNK